MTLLEALNLLKQQSSPVLKTHEAAGLLKLSRPHTSQVLRRLALQDNIIALKRGLWLIDLSLDGYQLTSYMTAPFPGYVSLQSALYLHGMISQIPDLIYVMTLARSQRVKTAVASYSLHHVSPDFCFAYTLDTQTGVVLACPEKALIDFLYLSPSKSHYFKSLPELTLPEQFDMQFANEIIQRIPSNRTRALVQDKFACLLN